MTIEHAKDETVLIKFRELSNKVGELTARPLPFFGKDAHRVRSALRARNEFAAEIIRRGLKR